VAAVTLCADIAMHFLCPFAAVVTDANEAVERGRRIILFLSVDLFLDCSNRGRQSFSSYFVVPLLNCFLVGATEKEEEDIFPSAASLSLIAAIKERRIVFSLFLLDHGVQ
jgi:hypothetical protein